ncbi:MAG: Na/Pi symporter [Myxococcales bacterium]|jgi:phosphate:Na+ symporter
MALSWVGLQTFRAFASDAAGTPLDPVGMAVNTAGGLAIFFFGVAEMTAGLRGAAEDRLQAMLARFTRNPVMGVVTGTLSTSLIGSSSIVTILTVGLVSSGLLVFRNALGVVMGANIGTTMTSQFFAFGLTDYFAVVLVTGAVMRFLIHRGRSREWGTALMGIGFVFLGLETIEGTLAPLQTAEWFLDGIRHLENVWLGIAIGAGVTAIIQSSSATMGVVIVMASQGVVSLPAGIAIMMGAELGTCTDTLASTIGQPRTAVRTGVFHLVFNVFNVLLLVWLAEPLAQLATALSPGTGAAMIARQIANAHVAFNTIGVLVMLPFTGVAASALERVIPEPRPRPARVDDPALQAGQ